MPYLKYQYESKQYGKSRVVTAVKDGGKFSESSRKKMKLCHHSNGLLPCGHQADLRGCWHSERVLLPHNDQSGGIGSCWRRQTYR